MTKRIVICADGTWNRPEVDLNQDYPTNVLKLARAIRPFGPDGLPQQVFYDWGVGSYYGKVSGGISGKGLHKNIMDDYRYIVQNYDPGDQLYLFGFSRGAYTIRSLCGFINNCGILKRSNAELIQEAFNLYKRRGRAYAPSGKKSVEFRGKYSHPSREVQFVGVWDTVGAMGIPISFLGLFEDRDEFYDTKIGGNVRTARHALAIDEQRSDFEPTIWDLKENMDMEQVWFAGAHSNIGGGIKPDRDGSLLSDISLRWMVKEARRTGLGVEAHLHHQLHDNPLASAEDSRRSFYRLRRKYERPIAHQHGPVYIHRSVKQRWEEDSKYRPPELVKFVESNGWGGTIVR